MSNVAGLVGNVQAQDVPPLWRRTTLGEIGEYINGRGFKKSEWSDTGLPIIRIQNLTGTGKEQNHYDGEIDERHVVNPGDLLISWSATLGAFLWTGPRAALNQHIFKVRSRVDKKFHYYLMQHILSDLYRQTHGAGMVHITKSKFDSMPVVVPETEDDQKRIVAEIEKQFSRLDEAVANLKRVKANLKRYKAAVLKAAVEGRLVAPMVGSAAFSKQNWKPIGLAIRTLDQGWSPLCESEPAETDETWAVMKTTAVQPMQFMGDENKRLPPTLDPRQNLELVAGDLLITRAGPRSRVGVACLVKTTRPHLMLCDKAYRLRVKPDVAMPAFLEIVLNSPDVLYVLDELKTGISDSGLNLTQKRFKDLLVPLPPLVEQSRVITEVERNLSLADEAEEQVNANLQRAERLRSSILANAFLIGKRFLEI